MDMCQCREYSSFLPLLGKFQNLCHYWEYLAPLMGNIWIYASLGYFCFLRSKEYFRIYDIVGQHMEVPFREFDCVVVGVFRKHATVELCFAIIRAVDDLSIWCHLRVKVSHVR